MATSNIRIPGIAAVILCGGASRRMGFDKWKLPIGEFTLLDHIVNTLSTRASRVIISVGSHAATVIHRDDLSIVTVRDRYPGCGPMEGIRAGLECLAPDFEFAFVTACDVPLFDPGVIDFLATRIGLKDAAIPVDDNRVYGLTALYRTEVHLKLEGLIKQTKLRVGSLPASLNAELISTELIRRFDPDLNCLKNINSPQDYIWMLEHFELERNPDFEKQLIEDGQPPGP